MGVTDEKRALDARPVHEVGSAANLVLQPVARYRRPVRVAAPQKVGREHREPGREAAPDRIPGGPIRADAMQAQDGRPRTHDVYDSRPFGDAKPANRFH